MEKHSSLVRNLWKWQIRLFYLYEGKGKDRRPGCKKLIFFPLLMWPSVIPHRRTYHSYAPSILRKSNPKYSLLSSKVVFRWQLDSTPPSRQKASLYSPSPGLYCGNDDRLSTSSNVRTGVKQRHNRIFCTSKRITSRSEKFWWPRLKQVRRMGTKLPQDINEVMWAKISLQNFKPLCIR